MKILLLTLCLAGCASKREINIDARAASLCHACSLRVEIKEER